MSASSGGGAILFQNLHGVIDGIDDHLLHLHPTRLLVTKFKVLEANPLQVKQKVNMITS